MDKVRFLFLAVGVAASLLPFPSAAQRIKVKEIREVYVKDFYSLEPESCTTRDVNLTHSGARDFFLRSKPIDRKAMTDNYPEAPCWVMGTLKYRQNLCDWRISAGSTGFIKCNSRQWFFACDSCEDLFK